MNLKQPKVKEQFKQLMSYLIPGFDVVRDYEPALILSWDEAHVLTLIEKDYVNGLWSRSSEVRRAL